MRFAQQMKERQIEWARLAGKGQFLEEKREWVLRKGLEGENLFDPSWVRLIDRPKQHRWFRALNSSKAFAVNLFGLVASDTKVAARAFSRLFPVVSRSWWKSEVRSSARAGSRRLAYMRAMVGQSASRPRRRGSRVVEGTRLL